MIKLFEQFNDEQKIHDICKKYNIHNYSINDDGSIDVNSNVDLCNKELYKLPLKFNRVSGYFNFSYNRLTSLEGSPNYVGGSFYCYSNKLTSLEGCPNEVGDNFNCSYNKLTSLEGSPNYVNVVFYCYNNIINKIDVECDIKGNIVLDDTRLDNKIKNLGQYYKKMLFKHGLDYKIFNDDGSINDKQFQHFLNDFKQND